MQTASPEVAARGCQAALAPLSCQGLGSAPRALLAWSGGRPVLQGSWSGPAPVVAPVGRLPRRGCPAVHMTPDSRDLELDALSTALLPP